MHSLLLKHFNFRCILNQLHFFTKLSHVRDARCHWSCFLEISLCISKNSWPILAMATECACWKSWLLKFQEWDSQFMLWLFGHHFSKTHCIPYLYNSVLWQQRLTQWLQVIIMCDTPFVLGHPRNQSQTSVWVRKYCALLWFTRWRHWTELDE